MRARRQRNYIRFFNIFRSIALPLEACTRANLAVRQASPVLALALYQHVDVVRRDALSTLHAGCAAPNCQFPLETLQSQLGLDSSTLSGDC